MSIKSMAACSMNLRCRFTLHPRWCQFSAKLLTGPSHHISVKPLIHKVGSNFGKSMASGNGNGSGGSGCKIQAEGDDDFGDDVRKRPLLFILLVFSVVLGANLLVALRTSKDEDIISKYGDETSRKSVTVIVPTLNEAAQGTISECIMHLRNLEPPPDEIIVVDGGSKDHTRNLARKYGADKVLTSSRGRARQQNHGVFSGAKGDLLLFVHADSRPPQDAVARVRAVLSNPKIVLGCFKTIIEERKNENSPNQYSDFNRRILWLTTIHNFISTYYAPFLFRPRSALRGLKCMFGDQSLFCRKSDFIAVQGFDSSLPIMEDADLCIRLHDYGVSSGRGGQEVQVLQGEPNATSGRRIASFGNWKATLVHFQLALAWWNGADPRKLRAIYDDIYTDNYRGL